MSKTLVPLTTMSVIMLSLFLATGFLSAATLAQRALPMWRAATPQDVDAALAPLPGIVFTHAASSTRRSTSDKRAKDRFQATEHQVPLRAHTGPRSGHMSAATTLGRVQRLHGGTGYENITAANALGTQYGVNVHFNTQKLTLALDTGSADTWAVSASANCTNSRSRCSFGPSFAGGFNSHADAAVDEMGAEEHEHLYIQYGDGEVVQGPMGPLTVSVAGLSVENQTVALANDTRWNGNNVTSGILGLAYPALTSAFDGPFGQHAPWYQREYSPVFASMVAQGLADNYFSVALSRRGADDGLLAFGGVPGALEGVDYGIVGMADIVIANVVNQPQTAYDYSFYTIIPDGWVFGTSTDDRKLAYILDTGTTLAYLPPGLADAINAAFEPAAVYDFMEGAYYTTCDATAPRVALVIDGAHFWLNPRDLLFRGAGMASSSGLCMTTIASGGSGPYILGDVFLQNVLAVFDVDDAVMQFAGRKNY